MKKLSFFALSLTLFSGVVSCSDDKDNPTPAATTKTDLLTAKNWRVSADQSAIIINGMTVTNDDYAETEACEKDDFVKFNTDKSVVHDQGPTKCASTANDPQNEKGTWDFNSDQTKLTLSDGGIALVFDIVELTATTLKVKYTYSFDGDGDGKPETYTKTQTYTAF